MSHLQQQPARSNVACPFLGEPCSQGPEVAAHCQLRVAQDFDPVAKFYQQEVIHCALCGKDFRAAEIQHVATRRSQSA